MFTRLISGPPANDRRRASFDANGGTGGKGWWVAVSYSAGKSQVGTRVGHEC
jgi:hypothetical protein